MNRTIYKSGDFLLLYAYCIPVKGKEKAAIYNLHKQNIVYVPVSMVEFIDLAGTIPLEDLAKQVSSPEILNEYLEFIQKEKLGFFTAYPERFPKMSQQYFSPEFITNAVIELRSLDGYNIEHLFSLLNECLCKHIELRLNIPEISRETLARILRAYGSSTIRSSNILLPYSENLDEEMLGNFFQRFKKISKLCVYSSPEEKTLPNARGVIFLRQNLSDYAVKDFPLDILTVNLRQFTESQQFNTYFNKKVTIDHQGYIRNDLRFEEHFGHIDLTESLKSVVSTAAFQRLWHLSVDQIEQIRDLPQRYAMTLSSDLRTTAETTYQI